MIKLVVELNVGGVELSEVIEALTDVGMPEPYQYGYKQGTRYFDYDVSKMDGSFQFGIIHRALEDLYPYLDTKHCMIHFQNTDSVDRGWYVHSNGLYSRQPEWT